jgi:hypothetical protein
MIEIEFASGARMRITGAADAAALRAAVEALTDRVNGHRSFLKCGLPKFPDPAGLVSGGDQPGL